MDFQKLFPAEQVRSKLLIVKVSTLSLRLNLLLARIAFCIHKDSESLGSLEPSRIIQAVRLHGKDVVANSFGFCAMGTGGGAGMCTAFSSDGINWLVNASFSAAHASITTSIYVVNDEFRISTGTFGGTRSVDGINWINESLPLEEVQHAEDKLTDSSILDS